MSKRFMKRLEKDYEKARIASQIVIIVMEVIVILGLLSVVFVVGSNCIPPM